MNFTQMLPVFLIVLAVGIFVKSKILRIICGIVLLALVVSVLCYVGILPDNFNVVELVKSLLGLTPSYH